MRLTVQLVEEPPLTVNVAVTVGSSDISVLCTEAQSGDALAQGFRVGRDASLATLRREVLCALCYRSCGGSRPADISLVLFDGQSGAIVQEAGYDQGKTLVTELVQAGCA